MTNRPRPRIWELCRASRDLWLCPAARDSNAGNFRLGWPSPRGQVSGSAQAISAVGRAHRGDCFDNPPDRFSPVLAAAVLKRRSIAQQKIELQGNLSTSELIALLKEKSEDSIERRLECAFIVRKLWDRVNAGEMGAVNWYVWGRKNIKLGKTQLKGLMRVANADNPREEAERQFALGFARTERLAARLAHETDIQKSARKTLQRFAKYDPIEKVMRIHEIRCQMYSK